MKWWPSKKKVAAATSPIIGNYNLTAQLPNGRSIAVAGYLYEGEDIASINERLDLCQEAIERQRTRCEIPELEAKREMQIKAMQDLELHYRGLEEKQRQSHLTSQEKLSLQNWGQNAEKLKKDIEKGDAAILEAKKRVGMGA